MPERENYPANCPICGGKMIMALNTGTSWKQCQSNPFHRITFAEAAELYNGTRSQAEITAGMRIRENILRNRTPL